MSKINKIDMVGFPVRSNLLLEYDSDASFVSAKGSSAAKHDWYYNSTLDVIKYYNGSAWVELSTGSSNVVSSDQTHNVSGGGTALQDVIDSYKGKIILATITINVAAGTYYGTSAASYDLEFDNIVCVGKGYIKTIGAGGSISSQSYFKNLKEYQNGTNCTGFTISTNQITIGGVSPALISKGLAAGDTVALVANNGIVTLTTVSSVDSESAFTVAATPPTMTADLCGVIFYPRVLMWKSGSNYLGVNFRPSSNCNVYFENIGFKTFVETLPYTTDELKSRYSTRGNNIIFYQCLFGLFTNTADINSSSFTFKHSRSDITASYSSFVGISLNNCGSNGLYNGCRFRAGKIEHSVSYIGEYRAANIPNSIFSYCTFGQVIVSTYTNDSGFGSINSHIGFTRCFMRSDNLNTAALCTITGGRHAHFHYCEMRYTGTQVSNKAIECMYHGQATITSCTLENWSTAEYAHDGGKMVDSGTTFSSCTTNRSPSSSATFGNNGGLICYV